MRAPMITVKRACLGLLVAFFISQAFPGGALCQIPYPDDDSLNHDSGSVDNLCFCDGKFTPDEFGIIKFPVNQPGCACLWWHVLTQKGMCGPCGYTCPQKPSGPRGNPGTPLLGNPELGE